MPASEKLMIVASAIAMTGRPVDSMPTARPWMTLVPWPLTDAWAMVRTGRNFEPV